MSIGADGENRTLVDRLEAYYSTIELHPQLGWLREIESPSFGPQPSALPLSYSHIVWRRSPMESASIVNLRLPSQPAGSNAVTPWRDSMRATYSYLSIRWRKWSRWSGSNRRHPRWQRDTLPLSYTCKLERPGKGAHSVRHPSVRALPSLIEHWSGRQDLNLRRLGPKPSALPD
jgi:hypothetical protein